MNDAEKFINTKKVWINDNEEGLKILYDLIREKQEIGIMKK